MGGLRQRLSRAEFNREFRDMTIRIVIAARADRDAQEIFAWLAAHSPAGAASWFDSYLTAVESLRQFPLRGGLAEEGRIYEEPIRQILFRTKAGRNYRLLYSFGDQLVTVLHVRGLGQRLLNEPESD